MSQRRGTPPVAEFPALQSSYAAGEVAPGLRARVDLAKYRVGLQRQRNFFSVVHGGSVNRPGTQFVDTTVNMALAGRLVRFKYSTSDTYILEFGNAVMRVIRNGAYVQTSPGVYFTLATPYGTADLSLLKFVQSFDKMTITHPDFQARSLTRTGHAAWTLTVKTFAPVTPAPTGFVSSSGPGTVFYAVTAVSDETGEESLPLLGNSLKNTSTLTWTPVAGCSQYNIYNLRNGLYGFIGTSGSTGFTDNAIVSDSDVTPPASRDPISAVNERPVCSTYWAQRSIYAGSWNRPQTVYTSVAGALDNMCVSKPSQADDAITKTLNSREVNAIQHMVPLDDLLMFTTGGLWRGTSTGSDGVTAASLSFFQQTYSPISGLPPIVIGEDVLFTHAMGATVFRCSFEAISTRWRPTDVSVLSRHFFDGLAISDWCYAEVPFNLIWAVRNDGKLLSFTYLKEQEVFAWALHDVGGVVESIASVPEGTEDAVYMIVRRTINGGTKRYVERLHSRTFASLSEAWFLDCALRYSGAPATIISGLGHLEGQTVTALADGIKRSGLVVTGGSITLPVAASVVIVGLPIVAEMQTLGVETQPTVQGKQRRVTAATLSLLKSRGGQVGPDLNSMSNLLYLDDLGAPGTSRELFTGDQRVLIENDWNTGGAVYIRQTDPYPISVLGDVLEVGVG